jgi:phospholipid-binding lipoprotein MlaA
MMEQQKKSGWSLLALSLLAAVSLSACASSSDGEIADPLEKMNRGIFAFNDTVDEAVLKPVAKGYRAAVPQPARTGVRNFLHNLKSPTIIANDLLQGNLTAACDDTTRMMANTLLGFGGLVDVGNMGGLKYREEDFGQTLGSWGMGHGFYLVLPLLGPSSGRDTVGMLADTYVDPVRLWLTNTDSEGWYYGRVALASVDKREDLLDVLEDLKKNSIDYYAALRSAYGQRREAQLHDVNPDDGAMPDMP